MILISGSILESAAQPSWSKNLPTVGTFSSPRVTDLNGDGIGDVVIGAGREEFKPCDSAIIALDGKTGEILWKLPAADQIFGSASLKDITGDGIMDVFITGRASEFQVINGKTGTIIWKFDDPDKKTRWNKRTWFNFYNPQFIPDQNNDGVDDILVSNGGNVRAEPYDPNRPVGHLVVLSSIDGSVLAFTPVPDGKETYMSIAAVRSGDGNDMNIIYGTGGETIGGSLYVTKLSDVMKGDISNSVRLDSSPNRGYIGPPAWVDITADGVPDILDNSVDGRLLAFDGRTYEKLWQATMPGTEVYSSISVGNFNSDDIADIFVSYGQGVWPALDWTKQYMVNGKNGNIEFTDSLGFYQTSTPVIADFTQDGIDDAFVVINYMVTDSLFQRFFYHMLAVVDFTRNEMIELGVNDIGHNLSSTPWIGDMNNDGNIDIVYCHGTNLRHTYTFDGMNVVKISTTIPIRREIKWGAYMGSNYDGVFR
ncbi:MAG TPA: PQQ-binding-like beta-propeller repeat protein [Cyclobacteriaceae bacterium]|nr:PQQ-binding-like beta-propeller repeat protein [Cyclobacteriaceae bacterium]